jgi:hypothetical protein
MLTFPAPSKDVQALVAGGALAQAQIVYLAETYAQLPDGRTIGPTTEGARAQVELLTVGCPALPMAVEHGQYVVITVDDDELCCMAAVEAERAAVVAWLREHKPDLAFEFADAIERGDHV